VIGAPSTSRSWRISTNDVDESPTAPRRAATIGPQVHARMPEPPRRQREEAGRALLGVEVDGAPRAQQVALVARDLRERTDLHRELEPVQRPQDAPPVQRARIPLLPLQVDVQVPQDAGERQRIGQRVHDRLAIFFGDDRLDARKDAQQRPRQRDDRIVLLGAEVVGLVGLAVDGHRPRRAGAVLGGKLRPLAAVDAAAVADLDAD
jgi:hypothetical protein